MSIQHILDLMEPKRTQVIGNPKAALKVMIYKL
jgi:hypothetical protein